MQYLTAAITTKGISRTTNQDTLLVKHTTLKNKEVVLAIVCDGVGGLSKGEVASQFVTREFDKWFDECIEDELTSVNLKLLALKLSVLLKEINAKLKNMGDSYSQKLGTTFTGLLIIDTEYICIHVGDSRLYKIGENIIQLTKDHTLVEQEVEKGNITPQEARNDKRQNVLLQCVGVSENMEPQVLSGTIEDKYYLLCSDGFRHKLSDEEIKEILTTHKLDSENKMTEIIHNMINLNMKRKEKDNISAILINNKSAFKNKAKCKILSLVFGICFALVVALTIVSYFWWMR